MPTVIFDSDFDKADVALNGHSRRQWVAEAIAEERERCAKVAENFIAYTGLGSEDKNDLIGMFARGNRNAKQGIAAAIRGGHGQTASDYKSYRSKNIGPQDGEPPFDGQSPPTKGD